MPARSCREPFSALGAVCLLLKIAPDANCEPGYCFRLRALFDFLCRRWRGRRNDFGLPEVRETDDGPSVECRTVRRGIRKIFRSPASAKRKRIAADGDHWIHQPTQHPVAPLAAATSNVERAASETSGRACVNQRFKRCITSAFTFSYAGDRALLAGKARLGQRRVSTSRQRRGDPRSASRSFHRRRARPGYRPHPRLVVERFFASACRPG